MKDELAEEVVEEEKRLQVYNDVRNTVIALYKRLQRHIQQENIIGGENN